ncbi:VWA domain-containing protein [Escherichia coli]|nr:VWA domain-containing protein [Escherichia coli]
MSDNKSLVTRIASRFGVDTRKFYETLKATAFKQRDGSAPTDEQMMTLLIVAEQYGLNPFTREIYAFPDKQNGIIPVVGVDGWSRIINEHPQYDGVEFVYSDKMVRMQGAKVDCPEWIECVIYRKDRSRPTPVFERVFPQGVVVRLNALLRKAVNTKSTAEVTSLADQIIKMIEEEKEKEEQKPLNGQDGNNQQNAGGNQPQNSQGGSGNDQNQGPDANGGDQQGKDQKQDDANGKSDPKGQGDQGKSDTDGGSKAGQSQAGGNSDAAKQDAAKMLQQVLNAGAGDLRGDAHDALKAELNRVAQDKGDSSYMTVRSAVNTQDNPAVGKSLVGDVKSTTSKIRTQLYGLVQASQRVAHRNQRSGKRVDARKLHRVVTGDTRVFLKPEAKKRPNTAVHILVDMSSSMAYKAANGKERQDIAREASLAISMALEAIPGVNPAVTFFGGNRNQPVFSVVKHGDTVQNRAGRFGFKATGGTPMAEAMWYAAFELTKTREERKMLIVVTDGQPQSAPACRSVIDLCERSDVEVIGIGVETTAVSGLFQKNIVIDDAAALQRTLFKLMERSLTAFAA